MAIVIIVPHPHLGYVEKESDKLFYNRVKMYNYRPNSIIFGF